MRAAITAGITEAVEHNFPIVPSNAEQWADFITEATDQVLQALAAAGHDTTTTWTVLPQATPVAALSLTEVIAQAATDALNNTDADISNDEDADQPLGACILTEDDSENENDCTTHEHEAPAADEFANHVVYQLPGGNDQRQVRNLVKAIAPLFGAAVYYRYDRDNDLHYMDVASPTNTQDVFTQTVAGLTTACRQHITELRMYPRAAATLYATVGNMLADDLHALSANNEADDDDNPGFLSRASELPTSRTMLRRSTGAPASRLAYVQAADEHSEIAGTARILLIENAPTV
ncbi:hypothetical protein [Tessaracoccus sp.]